MTRTFRRIGWSAVVAGAAVLWPVAAESPPIASPRAASTNAVRDVHVSSELIAVDVIRFQQPGPVAARRRIAPAPVAQVRERSTPSAKPQTSPSLARRLLLGDGRHRPEPFPTVKR